MGRTALSERQGEKITGTLLSPLLPLVDISFRMPSFHVVARNQDRTALQRVCIIISKYSDVVDEKTDKITGHKKRERNGSIWNKELPVV